jgi:hypothetical protein
MKTLGILFFLFIQYTVAGQAIGLELKATNKEIKISLSEIMGNWFNTDSTASKISFTNINDYFVDLDGIKHGVGNYSFRIYGDSLSVNGSAPNWPPYDCTLRLLPNDHLEIAFYQFYSTASTKVIYRR